MGLGRCFPFFLRASHLEKLPAVLHQEVDDDLVVSPDRALERRVAKPVDRVRVHLLLLEEPLRDAEAALRRGEVEWGLLQKRPFRLDNRWSMESPVLNLET